MLNNHLLLILIFVFFIGGLWSMGEKEYGWVSGFIILCAVCGLAVMYNTLMGQPIW